MLATQNQINIELAIVRYEWACLDDPSLPRIAMSLEGPHGEYSSQLDGPPPRVRLPSAKARAIPRAPPRARLPARPRAKPAAKTRGHAAAVKRRHAAAKPPAPPPLPPPLAPPPPAAPADDDGDIIGDEMNSDDCDDLLDGHLQRNSVDCDDLLDGPVPKRSLPWEHRLWRGVPRRDIGISGGDDLEAMLESRAKATKSVLALSHRMDAFAAQPAELEDLSPRAALPKCTYWIRSDLVVPSKKHLASLMGSIAEWGFLHL